MLESDIFDTGDRFDGYLAGLAAQMNGECVGNVDCQFSAREAGKERNDRFSFERSFRRKAFVNLLVVLLAHMADHFSDSVFLQLCVFALQVANQVVVVM